MKVKRFRNAATLAMSVAFAGGVLAQTSTPQTTPQTQRPDSQSRQSDLSALHGQTVTLTVLRDGAEQEVEVVLGARPTAE